MGGDSRSKQRLRQGPYRASPSIIFAIQIQQQPPQASTGACRPCFVVDAGVQISQYLARGRQEVCALIILKMGSTIPALRTRRGDFEDWIISGAGLSRAEVTVIDVPAGDPLPPPDGEAGVIITGSHTMVTERKDWSERTADWLRDAVSRRLPVLGICYGHQLLAHAHGGVVGNNPNGREFGTVEVVLEGPANADELLESLPERFAAHEGHTQSVLKLPKAAVRLASNAWDANQAFRIGDRAWGIQFHPEFDSRIVREYVSHYGDLLSREGQDPDSLRETARDNPHGPAILTRFADLCRRGD